MPTYDFVCKHCHKHFSKNLPIGTKASECDCGKSAEKVFSAPAIRFSGSGFYASDSRPAEKPEAPSTPSIESKPAESSSGCCGNPSGCTSKTE